jgi:hypothetical protein
VIVDCAHYRDERRQHDRPMRLDRAAEICVENDGFVWLGLFEPDWVFAVYGLGSLLASSGVIYLWFRRSGHIGSA